MTLEREDLREELLAVLGARRELSGADDQFLVEGFINKLDAEIDARIDARMSQRMARIRPGKGGYGVGSVAPVLALAIPLIAIAGGIAGTPGIVAVAVAIIVALYFTSR
jgi:hypothetical protein